MSSPTEQFQYQQVGEPPVNQELIDEIDDLRDVLKARASSIFPQAYPRTVVRMIPYGRT